MRPLVTAAVVAAVIVAGCGGGPGTRTPEPITASASKATVGGSAPADAGYREAAVAQRPFNSSGRIAVAGDVQMDLRYRLRATAWRATYRKPGSPPSVFGVLSVPLASPDGVAVTIDPTEELGPAALAARAQGRYTDIGDVAHVGNRTATVLGNETRVGVYDATASAGGRVEVALYVATAVHAGDVVVAVGITPRGAGGEGVMALMEAIEH